MPETAAKVRHMQARVFVIDDDKSKARIAELEATLAQAEQQAADAKQQLHNHASQVWLEEEDRLKKAAAQKEQLMTHQHMESMTAHIRDNTLNFGHPEVIATTDAVHLALPLDPRKAVPMELPVSTLIWNWFHPKR